MRTDESKAYAQKPSDSEQPLLKLAMTNSLTIKGDQHCNPALHKKLMLEHSVCSGRCGRLRKVFRLSEYLLRSICASVNMLEHRGRAISRIYEGMRFNCVGTPPEDALQKVLWLLEHLMQLLKHLPRGAKIHHTW